MLAFVRFGLHQLTHVSPRPSGWVPGVHARSPLPAAACAYPGMRRPPAGGWACSRALSPLRVLALQLLTGLKVNPHVVARLVLPPASPCAPPPSPTATSPPASPGAPAGPAPGRRRLQLRRGLTSCAHCRSGAPDESSPRRAGAPNILLLIWDTVRANSLGLYGYARPTTPQLERPAAADHLRPGARQRALELDSTPRFSPGAAAELSFRLAHWLDGRRPLLAEALARDGYITAGLWPTPTTAPSRTASPAAWSTTRTIPSAGRVHPVHGAGPALPYDDRVRSPSAARHADANTRTRSMRTSCAGWMAARRTALLRVPELRRAHAYLPPEPWASAFRTTRARRVPMIWRGASSRQGRARSVTPTTAPAAPGRPPGLAGAGAPDRGLLDNTILW
jgi:hypothetical protein